MLHEPCKTPLMKPRERIGQLSIASAAPAGHSAPMPMPEQGAEHQQKHEGRRKAGDEVADRIPEDRDHQRRSCGRPGRRASPRRPRRPAASTASSVKTIAHFGRRDVELVGDRLDDQQEDGEVERVQGPARARPPTRRTTGPWSAPSTRGCCLRSRRPPCATSRAGRLLARAMPAK